MKFEVRNILFFLGLFIPSIFVFRALLLPGPAVWGDAPYFSPHGLKELVAEPYAWTGRTGFGGGLNPVLWLYPFMLLYGLLHLVFGATNDIIIRVIFYFPAILLAFITPIIFTRYLGFPIIVRFFSSLLYGLNTYFLLLIDGGQVGIALAYGIFPATVFCLHRLKEEFTTSNFFAGLGSLFLLSIADVRLAFVAVVTIIFWSIASVLVSDGFSELKKLKFLIPLGIAMLGLSSYWLVPLVRLGTQNLIPELSSDSFTSLLDTMFLFQPHWWPNEFGRVSPPPFYFVGIPVLVFGGLLFKHTKQVLVFVLCFLLFAFLVKGQGEPFGGWYSWTVINLPFGWGFRDSTKFFAPLLLFGGILVGTTVQNLSRFFVFFGVWLYLLFLVHPAILGNLNGVLASKPFPDDFAILHKNFSEDNDFFRTVWFLERHPFVFETSNKPAFDAKLLVNKRPFAFLNTGTIDRFNFMHKEEFLDWLRVLGIKYLVFSGDPRKMSPNQEELEDWQALVKLAGNIKGLEQADMGTNFPVFKLSNHESRFFSVDKLLIIVGGEDIYDKLRKHQPSFSPVHQGLIFVEDGKVNLASLQQVAPDSVILVFNDKENLDLQLSFLQDYFVAPSSKNNSEWAIRKAADYLTWKFELLVNSIETAEFDYGLGVAFSSRPNEKLYFDLTAPLEDEYFLAVRSLAAENSLPLRAKFKDNTFNIEHSPSGRFTWYIAGPFNLDRGNHRLIFENIGGFQVVNTVGLIPKGAWGTADELASTFMKNFPVVQADNGQLINIISSVNKNVEVETTSPVRYTINNSGGKWLIFTDSYDPSWQLKRGEKSSPSIPFYSFVNGFYLPGGWQTTEIIFKGQTWVRWGLYSSFISFLVLAIIFLLVYPKNRVKHD